MRTRSIKTIPLLLTSVSAILGSGWLFTVYFTAKFAGPSSLISWIIGGILMILIAFVFAELCAMVPITGSSTRIPHYTHGSTVSFMFAWMIWLSYASLVPTETQAVIQYLDFYFPHLTEVSGKLTHTGLLTASVLMLLISILNIFSLRWLIRCNNILTFLKIFIPLFIAISILLFYFTPKHAFSPAGSSFAPFGIRGIFEALTAGGIVFAFNGFKQSCEIAGEVRKPKTALPLAIIGSISITLLIFLLLQTAFLSSITGENLITGWAHMHLQKQQSPLASIIYQDQFYWLVPILYTGAIVAPLAAALMFCNSSARSLFGMSKNGYIPKFFQNMTPQGNPYYAIVVNYLVGMLLFLPLPGWDKMVSFLTSLMAITYSVGPVSLLALRYQMPEKERPFRLPFDKVWCYLAFTVCTLLTYWSGWKIISLLGISLVVSLIIFLFYHFFVQRSHGRHLDLKASIWIWPYFIGIILISYLGNFGGGKNILPFGYDFIVIAVFCLLILYLAVKFRLHEKKTKEINHLPAMKDY